MTAPLLLVVHKRADTTAEVVRSVRVARPSRVYVAGDGARPWVPDEQEAVTTVRQSLERLIDWPCDVRTRWSEKNLGCGLAVKTAIDWFFENETEGIILEDDTVPNASFFSFATELLRRYRTDSAVGMIAGTNHTGVRPRTASYLFSRNRRPWGWAGWAASWQVMDYEMSWRKAGRTNEVLQRMGVSRRQWTHWQRALRAIDSGAVDAWDWQWFFSMAANGLSTATPGENLVANIGFRSDATHTRGRGRPEFTRTKELSFPLVHPKQVVLDDGYDAAFERLLVSPGWRRLARDLQRRAGRLAGQFPRTRPVTWADLHSFQMRDARGTTARWCGCRRGG